MAIIPSEAYGLFDLEELICKLSSCVSRSDMVRLISAVRDVGQTELLIVYDRVAARTGGAGAQAGDGTVTAPNTSSGQGSDSGTHPEWQNVLCSTIFLGALNAAAFVQPRIRVITGLLDAYCAGRATWPTIRDELRRLGREYGLQLPSGVEADRTSSALTLLQGAALLAEYTDDTGNVLRVPDDVRRAQRLLEATTPSNVIRATFANPAVRRNLPLPIIDRDSDQNLAAWGLLGGLTSGSSNSVRAMYTENSTDVVNVIDSDNDGSVSAREAAAMAAAMLLRGDS